MVKEKAVEDGQNTMINKRTNFRSEEEKNRYMADFWHIWYHSMWELITCPECGHVNKQYHVLMEMALTSRNSLGTGKKCKECETPMSWLDDRTYGKVRRSFSGNNGGLRDPDEILNPRITVWSMKDE